MTRHMFAILAIFILSIQIASAQSLPEGMKMYRIGAGEPDSTGWILADSTKGGFSVRLPVTFNDFTMESPKSDAPVSRTFVVGGKSAEGVKFTAARIVYRDYGTAQGSFSQIESGEAFSGQSPITRSFDVDGHRAVEITLNDGSALGYLRYILLDDSVMSLIVEIPAANRDLVPESMVQMYFDSLLATRL